MKDKYLGGWSILNTQFYQGFYIWRSILKARDLLQGFQLKVGNGEASFWFDDWTTGGWQWDEEWGWIWNLKALENIKFLLWLLCHNSAPPEAFLAIEGFLAFELAKFVAMMLSPFGIAFGIVTRLWRFGGVSTQCGRFGGVGINPLLMERFFKLGKSVPGHLLNIVSSVMNGRVGFSGLTRSSEGVWLEGFHGHVDCSSMLEVELLAILYGIRLCWQLGLQQVTCQSDFSTAVRFILQGVSNSHRYANIISTIQQLLRQDWIIYVMHVFREGNRSANFLSRMGVQCEDRFIQF
ncbi:Ribonuclease H domain [Sesbania bispinosa]|nr:Ribonuclease H domain [Sesbania bispinosa]